MATVNQFIKLQQSEDVIILDSGILADKTGAIRHEYSQDLLHLTQAGYAALNEQLKPVLASVTR